MSYWNACLACGQWYRMAVMQVDMYYWKTCGSGGHIFHENICYGRTCSVGGYVLQVCAEAATIEAAVSSGRWCVFLLQYIYIYIFSSETCFPRIYCLKCSSWVCRFIVVICLDVFFLFCFEKSIVFLHT